MAAQKTAATIAAKPKVTIRVVSGVEGPSIYVNEIRVAGPKPWGGGRTVYDFTANREDVENALKGRNT